VLSLRGLVTGFRLRRLWIDFSVNHVEFMVGKVELGQVYLRLLRLSLVGYHSTNVSHTHSLIFRGGRGYKFKSGRSTEGSVLTSLQD